MSYLLLPVLRRVEDTEFSCELDRSFSPFILIVSDPVGYG